MTATQSSELGMVDDIIKDKETAAAVCWKQAAGLHL